MKRETSYASQPAIHYGWLFIMIKLEVDELHFESFRLLLLRVLPLPLGLLGGPLPPPLQQVARDEEEDGGGSANDGGGSLPDFPPGDGLLLLLLLDWRLDGSGGGGGGGGGGRGQGRRQGEVKLDREFCRPFFIFA